MQRGTPSSSVACFYSAALAWNLSAVDAFERFLSNQRLFNVAVTRVRDDLRVITDDKEKLTRQLGRTTGDKYSALEEAGRLDVDKHRTAARAPDAPFNPGTIDGLDLPATACSLALSVLQRRAKTPRSRRRNYRCQKR